MLQIGTQVVYGIHGVCTIVDVEIRRVDRKNVEYFVLEPISQPGTRCYVPTQNQAAISKLRPILAREELEALFQVGAVQTDVWISDENKRKLKYRELISNCDRVALIGMIRMLLKHKQEQLDAGRKFHLCDENFLRDAQKLLSSECSFVLGIPKDEVSQYIMSRIGK